MEQRLKAFRCGFTIVEILLVVVLIGLIAGVAGGIYAGTYKKTLVKKSAMSFLLAAKYARILAIENQCPCRINLDVANNEFALVADRVDELTGQTTQVMVKDLYFKPVKFGGDVKFENIQIRANNPAQDSETGQLNTITFASDGTAQEAIIQIGDGKNHLTVSISAVTGKAKVYPGTSDKVKGGTIDLDEERR